MFNLLRNTYQGKKIFLTGHTGFKGSWLLKTLSLLGAEISGYALSPNSDSDLYNLIEGDKLCYSNIADLRDVNKLQAIITDFQPDYVFHLAAQPLVRLSYEIPAQTFEVNAIGTANVLDGVRKLNKSCGVILITTDKVYHNSEWVYPYREIDRLGGYDPYSASKACAELIIDSYRNSFFNILKYNEHGKSIAVTRAGNVIGGGDWSKDRLLPDIARALCSNQTIEIRNPNAIRPWQHVIEPIVGYLLLGAKIADDPIKYSTAYNFGPDLDDALPVEEMVKMALSCWGEGKYEVIGNLNQPHEAGLLKLDVNKVKTDLGWQSKMNAAEAIKMTIDWYKHFALQRETVADFTTHQIRKYLND